MAFKELSNYVIFFKRLELSMLIYINNYFINIYVLTWYAKEFKKISY
jgi:hypothetical protein